MVQGRATRHLAVNTRWNGVGHRKELWTTQKCGPLELLLVLMTALLLATKNALSHQEAAGSPASLVGPLEACLAGPSVQTEGWRSAQPEGYRPSAQLEGYRPSAQPEGHRPSAQLEGYRPSAQPEGCRPSAQP